MLLVCNGWVGKGETLMCGIAGIFHRDGAPASSSAIGRMTRFIAHRGPDGEGIFAEGPAALGHRRLAILDLTPAGQQPMTSPDGRFVISYNGEIYNFAQLRQELIGLGRQFRSSGDTEVLLQAFQHWGLDALPRLNGMFAFAIWDRRDQQMVLARDRYGIKPLYYAWHDDTLLFGSEIKALLAYPGMRRTMDREGLVEYITFQNFFTDRTLFQDVRLLPAGHTLVLRRGGPVPSPNRYWDYAFAEGQDDNRTDADWLAELDHLFRQAVARQMVSDVDVGAYLSGGTDSGSIASLASQHVSNLTTFTCGFDLRSASGIELNFDERQTAEHMSYLFRTEHYEMVLKAGDMERVLPRLAWHLEEPRVGQSYPNYYVARLASKFVKVCLSGAGGDEMFGGYPWRYYRTANSSGMEEYCSDYYDFWQRLVPQDRMAEVLRPIMHEISHIRPRDIFAQVFGDLSGHPSRPEDYVNLSLYFEAKTFLHGLLVVEDKLSMANGLETRVPFLDNDLVDFAMRLPVRFKLRNLQEVVRMNENTPGAKSARYFQRTNDGKLLLRRMMASYVPSSVAEREKQGFSAPDASWFKGESIDYVRAKLYDSNAAIYQFLDRKTLQGIMDEHLEGRRNHRLLIWSLLNLENWWEQFMATQVFDGAPPGHPA